MRLEGEQLGHYRLTSFIGGGGMGEVYLAEDPNLSRQVAIKVMKTEPVLYPGAQASKDAARLFKREMRAISKLNHAHILALYDAGEQRIGQENIAYMVMPYCPERSLIDWISRYHSKKLLSPDEVAQILQQAADALQYAHDNKILHLDVKPANFLVRPQQNPSQLPNLLLADFGVAKIATTSELSRTARGTLEYMAPEQIEGAPVAASDQYALGIMIYKLLTGRTPYQGALPHVIPYMRTKVDPEPPSSVNPSLPRALDKVVLRALAKKPQDRFASVKEFAPAFAGALKPIDPKPRPIPPIDPGPQPISPKRPLSPQAYELARNHQLGTPLEEFRLAYQTRSILAGILGLILAGVLAIGAVVSSKTIVYITSGIAVPLVATALIVGLLGAWCILLPIFRRSWRVYLYSGGFVYKYGKKFEVLSWSQITEVKKRKLRYILTCGDGRKVVLRPPWRIWLTRSDLSITYGDGRKIVLRPMMFQSSKLLESHLIHEVDYMWRKMASRMRT